MDLVERSIEIGTQQATEYTLSNPSGVKITVISYGGTITSIRAPDINGIAEEITLCYDSFEDLINKPCRYYGCTVGRVANRIANGRFSVDGTDYVLSKNNGPNSLHGGTFGFDKKVWSSHAIAFDCEDRVGVEMQYFSVDSEEGFPGNMTATVRFILNVDNEICIQFEAIGDKSTPVNMTNHTYWNLSGNCRRKILDHHLQLYSDAYLPTNEFQIPLGCLTAVENTPFDFRSPYSSTSSGSTLGDALSNIDGGVDHCFVLNRNLNNAHHIPAAVNDASHWPAVTLAAVLTDPQSRRQLQVSTSQPGLQVYTANKLSVEAVGEDTVNSHKHCQHNAVCLETQHYPDAVNQPQFPNIILQPNQVYKQKTVLKLCVV